jgi:predicted enzyme related to lactoylglutathione lyase
MFTKNGKVVAGGMSTMSPEQPPAWSTYVMTADADASAQKVRDAGGQVIMGPMDVMDAGRLAVFTDTEGAFIGVWQPKQHKGAELVNETGSFGWNELESRNIDAAKAFYPKVFGWEADTHDMPGGMSYTEWKLNGKSIGGAMDVTNMMPAEVPPHWMVYFMVEDADEGVAKVQELGGKQISPPIDIEPQTRHVLSAFKHPTSCLLSLSHNIVEVFRVAKGKTEMGNATHGACRFRISTMKSEPRAFVRRTRE